MGKAESRAMVAEVQSLRPVPAAESVVATLRQASVTTGSDFDYLLSTAMRESSLQPQAKSKSSSATGLFQFIDQTWLDLVRRFGEKHGLGNLSGAIERQPSGCCAVNSAELRAEILALRQDPRVSALMAGEAAKETKASLESSLGRELSGSELYAAHFLGRAGARKLFTLQAQNPDQRADAAFPEAAKANRTVFYRRDGGAKTIGEVYNWLVNKPEAPTPVPFVVAKAPTVADVAMNGDVARVNKVIPKEFPTLPTAPRADVAMRPAYSRPEIAVTTLPRGGLMLSAALIEILSALGSPNSRQDRAMSYTSV